MNSYIVYQKLYNGRKVILILLQRMIALLHIPSGVERIVEEMVDANRIVFSPGTQGR